MFVPMAAQKLKPVGTTVRFQFLLADGTSAFLGEGVVRQLKGVENDGGPVGMLVKFTKLSQESKSLVDQVVEKKSSATEEAPAEEGEGNTGVIEAEKANSLRSAAGFEEGSQTAEHELDAQTRELLGLNGEEDNTAEAELPLATAEAAEEEVAEEPATSGDEIFGEPEADPIGVAAEVSDSWGLTDQSDEEEALADADVEDDLGELFDDADWGLDVGAAEEEDEEEAPEEAQAPIAEPEAIKETEAGIKVLSFDGTVDESGTRDFEEFTAGSDEAELDEIFDNVFGGDGGGFFDEPAEELDLELVEEPSEPMELAEPAEEDDEVPEAESFEEPSEPFELSDPIEAGAVEFSEPGMELSESAVLEEASVGSFQESPPTAPAQASLPPEPMELGEGLEEESDDLGWSLGGDSSGAEEVPVEFEDDPFEAGGEEDKEEEFLGFTAPEPAVADDDGSDILSLLEMEDEGRDMELNLAAGRDLEEPSDDGLEEDSLSSLIASAKEELEGQKEEEPKGDIFDELMGDDDDLPPAAVGPNPFEVPTPEKKKKKGIMSKFFGK